MARTSPSADQGGPGSNTHPGLALASAATCREGNRGPWRNTWSQGPPGRLARPGGRGVRRSQTTKAPVEGTRGKPNGPHGRSWDTQQLSRVTLGRAPKRKCPGAHVDTGERANARGCGPAPGSWAAPVRGGRGNAAGSGRRGPDTPALAS